MKVPKKRKVKKAKATKKGKKPIASPKNGAKLSAMRSSKQSSLRKTKKGGIRKKISKK